MKREPKKLAKRNFIWPSCVRAALICTVLAFLMPLLFVHPEGSIEHTADAISDVESSGNAAASQTEQLPAGGDTLTVLIDGENRTMTMQEYLWGVVAAEMPAAFEQEALNAQAIAARTYTLYRMEHPGDKHPDADICGDAACCQAWISYDERMENWSAKSAETYAAKITEAVESTENQIISYDGEPILAAFHASSAGFTKSALDVWGEDFPYLREVQSPEETDSIPNYYSTVEISAQDCRAALEEAVSQADLSSDNCADWFGEERYDDDGLPNAIKIGGVWVDTSTVRSLFQLRSATFTVEAEDDTVTFYVTGYGHGVGMSQYGANALAKQGKTAEEILKWYYTGVKLTTMG